MVVGLPCSLCFLCLPACLTNCLTAWLPDCLTGRPTGQEVGPTVRVCVSESVYPSLPVVSGRVLSIPRIGRKSPRAASAARTVSCPSESSTAFRLTIIIHHPWAAELPQLQLHTSLWQTFPPLARNLPAAVLRLHHTAVAPSLILLCPSLSRKGWGDKWREGWHGEAGARWSASSKLAAPTAHVSWHQLFPLRCLSTQLKIFYLRQKISMRWNIDEPRTTPACF